MSGVAPIKGSIAWSQSTNVISKLTIISQNLLYNSDSDFSWVINTALHQVADTRAIIGLPKRTRRLRDKDRRQAKRYKDLTLKN